MKKRLILTTTLLLLVGITFSSVVADDGVLVRKSISKEGQENPLYMGELPEAEHAFVSQMDFYVQAQAANGTVYEEGLEYYNIDEVLVDTRDSVKPLIGVYVNGPSEGVEGVGFVGHGLRDAFGAVSFDDGETWKNTNLSESADKNSSQVERPDIGLFSGTDYAYPGDVYNIFHDVAGDSVLVAWPSRFCSSGQPNFALYGSEDADAIARREAIAAYMGISLDTASPDDLYLIDMYGVAGSQGEVDYATEDDWEPNQAVGEVPYGCLWTARGKIVGGDDPRTEDVVEASYMRWFKAERLTSGRRDVFRIETQCVAGAGCAITWQEDPDGLRGGKGLGPGEGWSGATAHSSTDIWYSYIDWEFFDVVQDPADETGATPMIFTDYELTAQDTTVTQKPKPFVPFAMPMRLTDNAKCNVENPMPYCIGEANLEFAAEEDPIPTNYGLKDMCADTVEIPTGPQDQLTPVCVTEDGLPLVGNTASTRPRLNLFGYDSTSDKVKDAVIDSAFVVVIEEEDKGLGAFGFNDLFDPNAAACDPEESEECEQFDSGKNILYHSFSMSLTDDVSGNQEDTLVMNLANHGGQLNQPEVSWEYGEFYPPRSTEDMWDFGDYNYEIYNTEIARRGSLLAQDIVKVHNDTSSVKAKERLLVLATFKQGAMNQGGPADVLARRILLPGPGASGNWKLSKDGNPYAFRNMACEDWAYDDGSNPYYPYGLCMDTPTNLSASVPDTCINTETGADVPCPQVDFSQGTTFGIGDTNPILQGVVQGEGDKTKVLTWHSCPAEFTNVSGVEQVTCDTDARTNDSTLTDQTWYNPLEVSKGHRGFLDGDFVMILYAWSPNWKLNTQGKDRYELYVRRSFDGGVTWTTTPSNFTAVDGTKYSGEGTVTCETFRDLGGGDQTAEPRVCNAYDAGAAEQPRNVTQFKSMKFTTLDPRYASTAGTLVDNPYGEDIHDPSRYFIVYETGDNSTTAFGEAEPLDLFYSRAVMFGDNYQVWAEEDDLSVCYPSDPHGDEDVFEELIGSGFCNEFDQLEQGTPGLEASESSLVANPGGQFLYGAWSQLQINDLGEATDSDAMVRRIWFIDDYISETFGWDFGGGSETPE